MMSIGSYIYNQLIEVSRDTTLQARLKAKLYTKLRKHLIRVGNDPICNMKIGEKLLQMPLSHELPRYLSIFPMYDDLPRRIAANIRCAGQSVIAIDVGANIGDTLVSLCVDSQDRCIALEPNDVFYNCLNRNWGTDPRVRILKTVCGSGPGMYMMLEAERNGTSIFAVSDENSGVPVRTLDQIILEAQDPLKVNVIKIDTDGHDFDILNGAHSLIEEYTPYILVEFDPFGNPQFKQKMLTELEYLNGCGYSHSLVYDNTGLLVGNISCSNTEFFIGITDYIVRKQGYYLDVLFIPEKDDADILSSEHLFFAIDI